MAKVKTVDPCQYNDKLKMIIISIAIEKLILISPRTMIRKYLYYTIFIFTFIITNIVQINIRLN